MNPNIFNNKKIQTQSNSTDVSEPENDGALPQEFFSFSTLKLETFNYYLHQLHHLVYKLNPLKN